MFLYYLIKISLELILELKAQKLKCMYINKFIFFMGFQSQIFTCDLQVGQLLPIILTKGSMKFYFKWISFVCC